MVKLTTFFEYLAEANKIIYITKIQKKYGNIDGFKKSKFVKMQYWSTI